MKIAVDFDGTIVEHKYPQIGDEIPFATQTLKQLYNDGHELILWTYRSGSLLQEAIDFCTQNGVIFYAVNKSYPEEVYDETISRKVNADIFIDDCNFGGLPDWGEIYAQISGKTIETPPPPRKGLKHFFSK